MFHSQPFKPIFQLTASGNDGLLIVDVVPGGVADFAGLKFSDKVLKINDYTCTGIDHCEAMNLFEAAGCNIEMTILCKNSSNEKTIKVKGKKKIFGMKLFDYGYNYRVDPEFEEKVKAEKERRCGKCFDCFVFNRFVKLVEWLKPNDMSDDKAKEKFSDAGIQDVSKSISIRVKFEKMTVDDNDKDESDKHLEARDRRYSCLKSNVY